jgi:hypothetical protein
MKRIVIAGVFYAIGGGRKHPAHIGNAFPHQFALKFVARLARNDLRYVLPVPVGRKDQGLNHWPQSPVAVAVRALCEFALQTR